MSILYTAEVTVTGGRNGQARSSDGALEVKLSVPREMGGTGEQGTNPEQLFAAGYAACFQSALMGAARRKHLDVSSSVIAAKVGIGPTGRGGFALEVELHIELPGVERSVGEELVALADSICPYYNATRGNIPVKLILEKPLPTAESQAATDVSGHQ
jgi:osmotically inducible protein OsmC